eukprot:2387316-Amphidinium_carterae.1
MGPLASACVVFHCFQSPREPQWAPHGHQLDSCIFSSLAGTDWWAGLRSPCWCIVMPTMCMSARCADVEEAA